MKNILTAALMLLFVVAQAQVPQTISFQGFLTDTNGDPISGSSDLNFKIYRTIDDFEEWSEDHSGVTVTNGLYSVQLGSITPFSFAFDQGYELEITVDSETLSPRVTLNSSAFALGAANVFGETNIVPSDGNVGIGTLSPLDKLHVTGNARIISQLTLQETSGVAGEGGELLLAYAGDDTDNPDGFRIDAFNDGTDRLRIFNSGSGVLMDIDDVGTTTFTGGVTASGFFGDGSGLTNLPTSPWTGSPAISYSSGFVGIGTASPTNAFHIQGANASAGVFGKVENTDASGFAAWLLRNDNRSYSLAVGGSTATTAADKFYIFNGTTTNAALVIDAADNVGIGTENPGSTLDVNGIVNATGFTGDGSALSNLPSTWTGSSDIYYNSGFVGIGNTNPDWTFHVEDDAVSNINPVALIERSGATSAAPLRFQSTAGHYNIGITSSSEFALSGLNSNISLATDLVRIQSDGDVGIGNTSPVAQLHVGTAASDHLVVAGNTGLGGSTSPTLLLSIRNDNTGVSVDGSDNMSFFTGGTQDMIIESGGDVGIGTTSPAYQLDIESTSTSYVLGVNKNNATGSSMVIFERQGSFAGSITESGGTVSYNAFTGSHFASCSTELDRGHLVSLTGNYSLLSKSQTGEPIYEVIQTSKQNDPQVLGTFLHKLDDENLNVNAGSSTSAIMAVGNGEMWIVDNGENLRVGDYLISSGVGGHAMKDNGEFEIAYIVGRVAEAVNWQDVSEEIDGKKHKRVNVFFENFTKNHKAEKLEKKLEELENRFKSLESSVESKLKQLENNSNSQNL